MKKAVMVFCIITVVAATLYMAACGFGLNPASQSGTEKATISLTFPVLPGSSVSTQQSGDRAIVQGVGYLYIQTGMTSADASMYGPFSATPGVPVVITTIPPGSYPYVALIYVKNPDTNAHTDPIIPSEATSDGYLAALQALWVNDADTLCTSSFRLLTNVEVLAHKVNTISASLIPTTNITVTSATSLPGTMNELTKRFIKLTNVQAGFLTSGYTNMLCEASSMGGSATMYKVGLYEANGRLVFWDSTPRTLSSIYENYTATWTGADTYYLYFEYIYAMYPISLLFTAAP